VIPAYLGDEVLRGDQEKPAVPLRPGDRARGPDVAQERVDRRRDPRIVMIKIPDLLPERFVETAIDTVLASGIGVASAAHASSP
jgi:hypothetical protein